MKPINGIETEAQLRAQAQSLLQNKVKVNLKQEDLEVLFENAKLEGYGYDGSDEDAIAMFDLLDNEGNTAETSYKLFKNWLKDQAGGSNVNDEPSSTVDDNQQSSSTQQPPTTSTPEVVGDQENTDVVEEPEVSETPEVEETPDEVEDSEVGTSQPSGTVDETPVSDNVTPTAKNPVYERLMPNETKTLEIDGKSYVIANASKTANNFVYYMDKGKLVVEGSDLKLTAGDNVELADNVKFMGNRNTIDTGDGDDIVEVEGDMNMIYGGLGNDHIMMRGDYNTTDMSDGDDTVWMAGNNNVAMGQNGADNFFAIGDQNTFFGQDGIDASYYDETEGIGHEFRVEDKITDTTDFDNWVKGEDEDDGPPYDELPTALDGHEVRAYDDNTYTDKYEKEPLYYTEYRDIAYRELDAMTTENKLTGEGTVSRYNEDGTESSNIIIAADGNVTVKIGDETTTIAKEDVVYYDQDGNVVANPGSISDILERLATGKLTVGTKDGAITPGGTPPEGEIPDEPGTEVPEEPDDIPTEPSGALPTTNEVAEMINGFNTSIDDALTAAGDEYIAAMSNKKEDGTFDTSDDAAASQKYASTVNKLNTKKQVVVNTGLPLINTASNIYSSAADKTDDYYTKLYDLVMKTLEANKNYFLNTDDEAEEDLKAEADKANAELQELIDSKS